MSEKEEQLKVNQGNLKQETPHEEAKQIGNFTKYHLDKFTAFRDNYSLDSIDIYGLALRLKSAIKDETLKNMESIDKIESFIKYAEGFNDDSPPTKSDKENAREIENIVIKYLENK